MQIRNAFAFALLLALATTHCAAASARRLTAFGDNTAKFSCTGDYTSQFSCTIPRTKSNAVRPFATERAGSIVRVLCEEAPVVHNALRKRLEVVDLDYYVTADAYSARMGRDREFGTQSEVQAFSAYVRERFGTEVEVMVYLRNSEENVSQASLAFPHLLNGEEIALATRMTPVHSTLPTVRVCFEPAVPHYTEVKPVVVGDDGQCRAADGDARHCKGAPFQIGHELLAQFDVGDDGNCLFYALTNQLKALKIHNNEIDLRQELVAYVAERFDRFRELVTFVMLSEDAEAEKREQEMEANYKAALTLAEEPRSGETPAKSGMERSDASAIVEREERSTRLATNICLRFLNAIGLPMSTLVNLSGAGEDSAEAEEAYEETSNKEGAAEQPNPMEPEEERSVVKTTTCREEHGSDDVDVLQQIQTNFVC